MTLLLPPGATIGIVGGGQLGRMSAIAAARLGFCSHIFTPEAGSPASQVSGTTTVAEYTDHDALTRFAAAVDVVTFEFENLPAASLDLLASLKPVHPGPEILRISQDRLLEKSFLNDIGIATAPWTAIQTAADISTLPGILKTTRLGYDGKGQALVRTPAEAQAAFEALNPKPLVLEGLVDFHSEISVVVARNQSGAMASFDPVENRHKNHILDITMAPAPLPLDVLAEATRLARHIAESLNLIGLLAVEMFVTSTGTLLVNEIAPRPHNSGHWTLDACPASQFEMHIRAVAGLPLPPATRHSDAVMKNLVGPRDMELWPAILATPGLIPHHYGKAEAREGRKMAHFTRLFPRGSLPGEFGIAAALRLAGNADLA